MKILLINYRYFISGGPEVYLFNIKEKLEKEGHEVIPFSINSSKNIETPYAKYFVSSIGGTEATYYEDYKKTPRNIVKMISRSVYSFEVKKAAEKIITDTKPDVVYILHYVNKLSPSVIRAAKKKSVPVVLRLSDYFLLCPRFDFISKGKICEDCLKKGYLSCIKKRCVKNSLFASAVRVFSMKVHKLMKIYEDIDAFITPSVFLKDKLIANGFNPRKIHCIPTFSHESDIEVTDPEDDYGLYFGRITKEKGVESLVLAYEKMPSRKLMIVGDDSTTEAEHFKNYLNEHNISNIVFCGFKSGEELEKIIKGARMTFIPSLWYENLPNAALESFKHMKPVLASNIGSMPELILNGYNGFLFEPGNPDDIITYVKFMDDNELVEKMGKISHEMFIDRFSAQKHYELLFDLFISVAEKRKCK
jgi:glycosyltransferase involved in cell wall biosynthesis